MWEVDSVVQQSQFSWVSGKYIGLSRGSFSKRLFILKEAKLKNQNICEDHFKLHMFMNAKKERLTRFAYPSLLRVGSGEVVDLESDQLYENPWRVGQLLNDEDYLKIRGAFYVEEPISEANKMQIVRNFIQPINNDSTDDILIEKADGLSSQTEIEHNMNLVETTTFVEAAPKVRVTNKRPFDPTSDIQILTPVRLKRVKPRKPKIKIVKVEEEPPTVEIEEQVSNTIV